jgi:hypothetical protein
MGELVSLDSLRRPHSLQTGGGGGTFDGEMEARIKALEVRADVVDQRLGRIETKVDTLVEKVSSMEGEVRRLPGYPGLFTIAGVLVAVVAVLVRFLPGMALPT